MRLKKKKKILVVDDDPNITEVIEEFLSFEGYDVSVENFASKAVDKANEVLPDLILLDIMMPEIDGYEVCSALKINPKTSGVPILFLSGRDSKEDDGRSFGVGGDLYIKKPFSNDRLSQMVKMVLLTTSTKAR